MADLIRLVSLEGPLLGVGMLVALVWLIVTVKGLDAKVTGLDAKVTGLDARVANLATDVAFLRGRQDERDRQVDTGRVLAVDDRLLRELRQRELADHERT